MSTGKVGNETHMDGLDAEETAPTAGERQASPDDSINKLTERWWVERWFRAVNQWVATVGLAHGKADGMDVLDHHQVAELEIGPGLIVAWVSDASLDRCRVVVCVGTFGDAEWERVIDVMSHQAVYAAQLLNGEMPSDIEQVFRAAGVSLFPAALNDLRPQCSCSEHATLCQHIMAVYHALGKLLGTDPFELFAVRGRTRQQVMAALREKRTDHVPGIDEPGMSPLNTAQETDDQPLEGSLATFWQMGPEIDQIQVKVIPPEIEMEVIKLLGHPSFVDRKEMIERLAKAYRTISRRALEVAFGEEES
jgi:uncharacterized Zn finger protein